MKKKRLNKINKNSSFKEAAKLLLRLRIDRVKKLLFKYNEDKSTNNLHQLRISFRKLKFSLENFKFISDRAKVAYVMDKIKNIQNLLGEIRDIDVFIGNIDEYNIPLSEQAKVTLLEKMNLERERLELNVSSEIILFNDDKKINSFFPKKTK